MKNRKRVSLKITADSLTDQSLKKMCDINSIMNQYQKTGMLPSFRPKQERYIDCSSIPTLEASYEAVKHASEAFYALPATLRRLMDNDPSKLESFVSDPENQEILLKYGLLEKTEEITQQKSDDSDKVTPPNDDELNDDKKE